MFSFTRISVLAVAPSCAFVIACASVSRAEDVAKPSSEAEVSSDSAVWTYNPWENLKGGARHLFDDRNRWTLAGGAAALLGARALDEEANDYFAHKNRLGGADHLGNDILGTGVPGVLIGAGFWIYGDLTGQGYESQAGQAQIETLFVTAIFTSVLKASVNRERPDSADHFSFPSGHTSTVFASATALEEFYGWKVGVPAYLLGVLTGMSRMSEQKHWLSDTVGGALIGMLVGHAFARQHLGKSEDSFASRISFYPIVENEGGRVVLQARF
jgi:hypothetical protein